MTTACRLYLLTPPTVEDPAAFAETLARALDAGDVACLQIRLKDAEDRAASDDHIARVTDAILPIAAGHDVAVLMNDRPDLAVKLGADGVHIGQDDTPYAEARQIVGRDRIVGVTCHASKHLAFLAAEAGADYVAFGAFYETGTKSPKARAAISLLEDWALLSEVPCVAIGGITVDNARPLAAAGADFICVSAGVWHHPDGPVGAVAAFNRILAEVAGAT